MQAISASSPLNLAKAISPQPSHPMIGRLGWERRSEESLAPGSVAEPGLPAGTVIGRYRLVEAGLGPTGHSYRSFRVIVARSHVAAPTAAAALDFAHTAGVINGDLHRTSSC